MTNTHIENAGLFEHINNEFLKAEVDKLTVPHKKKSEPEITKLKRQLGQKRVQLGRLVDLYTDDKIDKHVLDERSESHTRAIEDLESQIRVIENGLTAKKMAAESIASFENLDQEWPRLTTEERRALLGLFIDEVHVGKGKGTDRVKIKWAD